MLHLSTLGPTELQTESGEDLRPVLAQPKRLGLLIYLAVESPDRFVRRDTLLALFWPELDEAQARQALRSALYFLRQHLGDQVVTSRGTDEVGASSAALRTDAAEFLRAAERGEAEAALALYHGDFLAGLHIPESSAELDQWMSHTRSELRRRAAGLAWMMAERAEQDRNPAGAAHWGRRAQAIQSDDEASLRRLMELLDRSGDPGGAIRAFDEFAGRLQADLGAEPDQSTRALAERLRSRRSASLGPRPARVPTRETLGSPDSQVPATPTPEDRRPSRRAFALGGFGFAVLLVAVVAALARRDRSPPLPLAGPVIVAAFKNETGDTSLSIWGRYAGDWITQGLQTVGRLPVVPWTTALRASRFADSAARSNNADPVGILHRETGANTVITGSYYRVNDSLRFRAEITDARSGKLILSIPGITAAPDSIEAVIRELRDRLMGGIGLASDRRFANHPLFGREPPRFAAFAAFDRGRELFEKSDYRAAAVELERAFGLDSSFVTPALTAGTAYINQARWARLDSLIRILAPRRDAMNEFQELQLAYLEARLKGDGRAALGVLRRASIVTPNSSASHNLAIMALHMNLPYEALRELEGEDPNAISVSSWPPYWTYLAYANHLTGHHDAELAAVGELRHRYPDRSIGLVHQVAALAALGRTGAIDSLFDADNSSPNTYWSTGAALVTVGLELAAHGHAEHAAGYLDRAITWLQAQRRTDPANRYHREWLFVALYNEGQWERARPLADSLANEVPTRQSYRTMNALLAARRGDTALATRLLGEPKAQERGSHLAARARIAAILGDTDQASSLLSEGLAYGVQDFMWAHMDWRKDFASMIDHPKIRRLLIEGFDRP